MGEGSGITLNSNILKKKMKSLEESAKWIVISLGGSLIVPEGINTTFISEFKKVILRQVKLGKRFIIVCGGGKIARDYQKAYKRIIRNADDDVLDWIGINATRLNAEFMTSIFGDMAYEGIISDPNEEIITKKPIIFAGGWKPGCSTDNVAVQLALNVYATQIINLSDIDCVYDIDPKGKSGRKAKRIKNISWDDYLKIIPSERTPGQNSPFDPVASREAQKRNIEVAIINGHNLADFESYLYPTGTDFMGTRINGILPLEFHPQTQGFKGRHIFSPQTINIRT